MKTDRTPLLASASLTIFLLSLLLALASVHDYCENRTGAAFLGLFSVAVLLMLLRNRPASSFKKTIAIVGGAVCVIALAVNVAFIFYATHLCRS